MQAYPLVEIVDLSDDRRFQGLWFLILILFGHMQSEGTVEKGARPDPLDAQEPCGHRQQGEGFPAPEQTADSRNRP